MFGLEIAEANAAKVPFDGKIVIIGFGSIGAPVIPLLFKHIDLSPERVVVITSDERNADIAQDYNLQVNITPLHQENFRGEIMKYLAKGDFLLNLSVDVSSLDLIALAAEVGALYLDTCIEPWKGGYVDVNSSPSERSNFFLRNAALNLRKKLGTNTPTAILAHGMNPGTVSHFVKQALVNMAADKGLDSNPQTKEEWARLAKSLGVKVIHIAEHDSQVSSTPKKPNEFVNTWSVEGFISEGSQPAELGWGSHEREVPKDAILQEGEFGNSLIILKPGCVTKAKTWTPTYGATECFVVTHNEAMSISSYFSIDGYNPTCHYAYRPCNDAIVSLHEFAGRNFEKQASERVLRDEIIEGIDELGVLLMGDFGDGKTAYWFGSQLSIEEARTMAPYNTATSLQITSGILSGVIWAIKNPERGIIEAEEMNHSEVLSVSSPYLGKLVGVYSDFTPLKGRQQLFKEDLDHTDPFQFKNFRV